MENTTELEKIQEKPEKKNAFLESAFEWASAAMVALLIVSVLFTTVFRLVNVSGDSMTNTLHNGERLVISNLAYTPEYSDIVILLRTNDTPLIKRVIGLPGDTIVIDNDKGVVIRNGETLTEPYVKGVTRLSKNAKGMTEAITVPEGHLYVLGDNREGSLDSRVLGFQPMENLVGRVLFRLTPFGKVE